MTTNISFALEYSLGHITHGNNLKNALKDQSDVNPKYFDIPYDNTPLPIPWSFVPSIKSNWTARASIVAYHSIKGTLKDADAAFFHTQVTSIFSAGLMQKIPGIVSLDATPLQYDRLGAVYEHATGSGRLEAVKKRLNIRSFTAARAIVTWSEWTKQSLVDEYGVSPKKVSVIPPGIDLQKWCFPRRSATNRLPNFLFVGGDFSRKGGETLVKAFESLIAKRPGCTLDIVTKKDDFSELPVGVTIHNGLRANSPELLNLYRAADVFVFPTRGDCLPLAVMEAMAAGLPVITTDVGALAEAVVDGVTGLIVDQDHPEALAAGMSKLADDVSLRTTMSQNARDRAQQKFDASCNYRRLIDLLLSVRK